jgi:hypothetical protein
LPLRLRAISFLHPLPLRLAATFSARTWRRIAVTILVTILGTLLPVLRPTSTCGSGALIGIPIAILGALSLVGVAIAIRGTPSIVGVAIAILGTSPIVGVAVTFLGTLSIVGVAVTILGTLSIVGVATLGRTTLLASCSARWIVTKPAPLARTKRTRRGYIPLRPDLGAGLPNRNLRMEAWAT